MLSNPILIGALTVLAAIVAVTLAYQANNGLPFVPKYTLHVQIANASGARPRGRGPHGRRAGGRRSSGSTRRATPPGAPMAVLDLKLNKTSSRCRWTRSSTSASRGRSGSSSWRSTPGHSRRTWRDGATVPCVADAGRGRPRPGAEHVRPAAPGRRWQPSTTGFSDGAGRPGQRTSTTRSAPSFRWFDDLGPVMRNLSSRSTDLGGFFHGLERYSAALAPVAQHAGRRCSPTSTPPSPRWPASPSPTCRTGSPQTPPTFSTVIADSPQRAGLRRRHSGLFAQLRPGFATLRQSAPVLADAFAAGARNLPGTAALDRRLLDLANRLRRYGQTPAVNGGPGPPGADRWPACARRWPS